MILRLYSSSPPFFGRGSDRHYFSYLLILLFVTVDAAYACWGATSSNLGNMTLDYDLLENGELVLNCSLYPKSANNSSSNLTSANLTFENINNNTFVNNTYILDDSTAQLRISNASVQDSGVYYCKANNGTHKNVVCISKVSVGYRPLPVKNFSCISLNFDNLTCTWDVEKNNVYTEYSVARSFMLSFQSCPLTNATFCQWSTTTDPPFQTSKFERIFHVNVTGKNKLGANTEIFTFDLYDIVILNRPEVVNVTAFGVDYIKVHWEPPKMDNIIDKPNITYQLYIKELTLYSPKEMLIEIGDDILDYKIQGLIPHMSYNISVRCRSTFTSKETAWSLMTSVIQKTLPDVPYEIPETIPEAFELHKFENFQSVTLYWKPVSPKLYNGEHFKYQIMHLRSDSKENSTVSFVSSDVPHVQIQNLSCDSQYIFHIHSANKEGVSKNFSEIVVNVCSETLPGPRDIRAISHGSGQYNLSWHYPKASDEVDYVVVWCTSLRPWHSRCDGPIHWINGNLTKNSVVLNLTDAMTNFQFAVIAKSDTRSSGMKWATCIVSKKAVLSKIHYIKAEQKNSSTLKVIWALDCPAQRTLVKRFEIQYCKVSIKRECKVVNAEADAESYLLQDLHPFSNYSIKIRAINKETNVASEDSEPVFESTSEGAPSSPPRNVVITSKNSSSFQLKWLPPLEPNGIISKYIVSYNGLWKSFPVTVRNEYHREISGLTPFTNYAVAVKACVGNSCSDVSSTISVETDAAEPGVMDPPRVKIINETQVNISWTPPLERNGPIDFYEIQWIQEGHNQSLGPKYKKSSKDLSFVLNLECSTLEQYGIVYLFYIRAVNVKDEQILYGPFSQPEKATVCKMPQAVAMIIGAAIGGTLALAFFLLLIYKLVKWMKEKIHQVKSITIRLPKGLEGPETNPLNNYENFKHGLTQNVSTNKPERLSYIIDENEKNRHGSGSSQYSNSSTDELIFKNGKCTKFGRKPSGDSSGCSSMSSNTTPRGHLSSDSGTESDFIPLSSESFLTDANTLKPTLPILVEMQDSVSSDQTHFDMDDPKQKDKSNNLLIEMPLKVDQPYSKFGVSGSVVSGSHARMKPLAIYSRALANSEPSVSDIHVTEVEEIAPYSKIGLAKSSGDILSKESGYSKFGMPFSNDFVLYNSKNPLLVNTALVDASGKKWPSIKQFLCYKKHLSKMEPPKAPVANVEEEGNYFKAGINNVGMKKPTSDYVPFNDVRDMNDSGGFSTLPCSAKPKYLYKSNSFANPSQVDDDSQVHSSVWTTNHQFGFENGDVNSYLLVESPYKAQIYNYPKLQNGIDHGTVPAQPFIVKTHSSLPHVRHSSEPSSHSDSSSSVSDHSSDVQTENNINKSNYSTSFHPDHDLNISNSTDPHSNRRRSVSEGYSEEPSQPGIRPSSPKPKQNGYVPFAMLASRDKDVPNTVETDAASCKISQEADSNYVTPFNKSDLKLLQGDAQLETDLSELEKGDKNYQNGAVRSTSNGVKYLNNSLKYILKPLPKMESEICEV